MSFARFVGALTDDVAHPASDVAYDAAALASVRHLPVARPGPRTPGRDGRARKPVTQPSPRGSSIQPGGAPTGLSHSPITLATDICEPFVPVCAPRRRQRVTGLAVGIAAKPQPRPRTALGSAKLATVNDREHATGIPCCHVAEGSGPSSSPPSWLLRPLAAAAQRSSAPTQSSCRAFMNAPAEDQDAAVKRIATDLGAADAVALGRPNVDYLCRTAVGT